jgi:hypothetical protein
MSDVVTTWLESGAAGFGPLTQAVLETQDATQVAAAGIVASQAFLRALIDAATNSGSV